MHARIFTGTTRYRRQIIVTTTLLAASMVWLCPRLVPLGSLVLVVVACAVLATLAWVWSRPAALTVDPRRRAFRAFPNAGSVYLAVEMVFVSAMGIGIAGYERSPTGHGPDQFGTVLLAVTVLAVGLLLVLAWRETGLEVRPDGLIDRNPLGTLAVPWEALAPGYPQPSPGKSLVLAYARPELVCRRHIASRRKLAVQALNADPRYLGTVIAHYVAYPQYRAAIGTQAEYDRLRRALNDPAGPLPATWR